jgi:hypothetical protein
VLGIQADFDEAFDRLGRDRMFNVVEMTAAELAPLMFRPLWSRFTVSGQVRRQSMDAGPDGPLEMGGLLNLAPGGRYRADLTDEDGEPLLAISNGQSSWIIRGDLIQVVDEEAALELPFDELFRPAWLLADFDIEIMGQAEHSGRSACMIEALRRETSKARKNSGRPGDTVHGLVDIELGILLRYEKLGPGQRSEIVEFTDLYVDAPGAADSNIFTPPPGSYERDSWTDTDAAKPAVSQSAQPAGDDVVNLLYRSGMKAQVFSAEVHEWADGEAISHCITSAISMSALRWASWIDQLVPDLIPPVIDITARFQIAMPGRYRIDAIGDPGSRPLCVSCDGERAWQVFADRVVAGPVAPLPAGIALLIDPAWLLYGYRLSTGGPAIVSGRQGLRVIAERRSEAPDEREQGCLSGISLIADKIEAVVDVQLGVMLHQAWYLDGKCLLTHEFSKVKGQVDVASFRVEPPPGVRVINAATPWSGVTPWSAARAIAGTASRIATDIYKWKGKGSRKR